MLYINLVKSNKEEFAKKVIAISNYLGIQPNWLMALMNAESRLDHTAENKFAPFKDGYATGLIQFTPNTARWLGTTTAELKAMSNIEQLDYVKKYFSPFRGKISDFGDLYLINFFPIAVGKPDDFIIKSKNISASAIAKANPIFDTNKDSQITVGEFKDYLKNKYAKYKGELFPDKSKGQLVFSTAIPKKKRKLINGILITIALTALGIAVFKK